MGESKLSRREFLKLGGVALAGPALDKVNQAEANLNNPENLNPDFRLEHNFDFPKKPDILLPNRPTSVSIKNDKIVTINPTTLELSGTDWFKGPVYVDEVNLKYGETSSTPVDCDMGDERRKITNFFKTKIISNKRLSAIASCFDTGYVKEDGSGFYAAILQKGEDKWQKITKSIFETKVYEDGQTVEITDESPLFIADIEDGQTLIAYSKRVISKSGSYSEIEAKVISKDPDAPTRDSIKISDPITLFKYAGSGYTYYPGDYSIHKNSDGSFVFQFISHEYDIPYNQQNPIIEKDVSGAYKTNPIDIKEIESAAYGRVRTIKFTKTNGSINLIGSDIGIRTSYNRAIITKDGEIYDFIFPNILKANNQGSWDTIINLEERGLTLAVQGEHITLAGEDLVVFPAQNSGGEISIYCFNLNSKRLSKMGESFSDSLYLVVDADEKNEIVITQNLGGSDNASNVRVYQEMKKTYLPSVLIYK